MLYEDYLLVNPEKALATEMGLLFGISHDQVTRFLSEKKYRNRELRCMTRHQSQKETNGVLILDDTIIEKKHLQTKSIVEYYVRVKSFSSPNLFNL